MFSCKHEHALLIVVHSGADRLDEHVVATGD
jgi:hypothetical protein